MRVVNTNWIAAMCAVFVVLGAGLSAAALTPASDAASTALTVVAAAAEPGGAEDAAHAEPSLFASDPWPYVWNLLMFLVLLAVLMKYVWPPILNGLQAREQKQRSDLQRAEQASKEATAKLEEYEARLKEAQQEAQRIIEQSKGDAQRVAAELKEQAQSEITQMRQRAQADIQQAKQQAIADLHSEAATLATDVAGRILQRELNPQDHEALVRESLDALSQAQRN